MGNYRLGLLLGAWGRFNHLMVESEPAFAAVVHDNTKSLHHHAARHRCRHGDLRSPQGVDLPKPSQRARTATNRAWQTTDRDRDEAAPQIAALRAENKSLNRNTAELLKLRGEVSVLRREKAQLSAARTNIAVVTGASEPARAGAIAFGAELRDMGARTPEQAANSLIWAATAGQEARVSELLELPKGVSEEDAPSHYKFFTKQLSNVYNTMEFLSVQAVKPNPDGTLRMNFAYSDTATGKTNSFPFMLRLHESGWRVVVEGNSPPVLPAN
jgi:hypothetical protein